MKYKVGDRVLLKPVLMTNKNSNVVDEVLTSLCGNKVATIIKIFDDYRPYPYAIDIADNVLLCDSDCVGKVVDDNKVVK